MDGLFAPKPKPGELARRVSVGIYREAAPSRSRRSQQFLRRVTAVRAKNNFNGGPARGTGGEDLVVVEARLGPWAPDDAAARAVAQDVDVRVLAAAAIRLVISSFSIRSLECTLATTTSRRASSFFLLV